MPSLLPVLDTFNKGDAMRIIEDESRDFKIYPVLCAIRVVIVGIPLKPYPYLQ